ncbi:MAG TPA: hypothetical protein PLG90_08565, partial [Ignavibacteria bacterium]|nr:hypothetical protein [Ignavibacteria bacterium]
MNFSIYFIILISNFFIFSTNLKSQGFDSDLMFLINNIDSNYTIRVKVDLYSIPFEGYNNNSSGNFQYNRQSIIQSGSVFRFFTQSSVKSKLIKSHFVNSNINGGVLQLASPIETVDSYDTWGFAKYFITIESYKNNELKEKYKFFLNSLDSKYGTKNYPHLDTNGYGRDIKIYYDLYRVFGNRVYIKLIAYTFGTTFFDSIYTSDTLSNGLPTKEFKVWKFLDNTREFPYEKLFYARTTSFPFNAYSAENDSIPRVLRIGTTVRFDTVFKNKDTIGVLDRWGYNTQNDPYYYNTNFIMPPDIYVAGNTYSTPRTSKWIYEPISQTYIHIYGIKLIAESGDSLLLNPNKRLFINGQGYDFTNGSPLGDTLQLLAGSKVILKQNAEIFTYRGGVIEYLGGQIVWENQACHRAFDRTSMSFSNGNYTVNNGGFIVIDRNANLNIGENTVITFDGHSTYLKLDKKSKVNLKNNAKIIFKNGAYLIADSSVFSSHNNEIWEGLVFENAGGLTEI